MVVLKKMYHVHLYVCVWKKEEEKKENEECTMKRRRKKVYVRFCTVFCTVDLMRVEEHSSHLAGCCCGWNNASKFQNDDST